jgi:hypothetical protein
MPLSTFPEPGSIPPACFYNAQGLAGWLEKNPEYKLSFAYTGAFPFLIPLAFSPSTFSTIGYDPRNVPLCTTVQTLSQGQAQKYNQQIQLFQKVYAYNSNAYVNYILSGTGPVYYNFFDYKEKNEYSSAVQLVNKLYPFRAMADAPLVNWQVPFPIGM